MHRQFLLAVLASNFKSIAIDACYVESLEPFKAVFIGNSLLGGPGLEAGTRTI
jgi:hypothetical protein